jgi:hypothetical protein
MYTYLLIFFLFLLDCSVNHFFQEPIFQSLIVFYIISLLHKRPWRYNFCTLILISLEQFIDFGRWGASLLYLLPATLLILKLQKTLHIKTAIQYLIMVVILIIHFWILTPILVGSMPSTWYTICKIIANILLMMILN